jgi:hypothetical protein
MPIAEGPVDLETDLRKIFSAQTKIGNVTESWLILCDATVDKRASKLKCRKEATDTGHVDFNIFMNEAFVKSERILWIKNCSPTEVADPCLKSSVKACGAHWSASGLSEVIVRTLLWFLTGDVKQYAKVCEHCVLLNGSILLTLVTDPAICKPLKEMECSDLTGVLNILDSTQEAVDYQRIAAVKPVREEYFEVAEEEVAIPVEKFYAMKNWTTYNCNSSSRPLLERRKWGHILFLSHRWEKRGNPGNSEDLINMQEAVRAYIDGVLSAGPTTTVKNVESADDFGVWLDYTVIPNDRTHDKIGCRTCKDTRRLYIAKMGALPIISTTIALHPEEIRRGWILHELTMNSHNNIVNTKGMPVAEKYRYAYGARINLMSKKLRQVHFTNGSDGWALKSHEFIRIGQMPRTWPSVTRVLLDEWKKGGILDEKLVEAKDVLFKYARTFHHDCQRLKRAMVVIPQKLARLGISDDDIQEDDWVQIWPKVPRPNPAYERDDGMEQPDDSADGIDKYNIFDLEIIRHEIEQQRLDMIDLGLGHSLCLAASHVQFMQFIAVTMGLRAELLYGSGIIHWIAASAITEALTTTKRSVRLRNGQHDICKASCNVSVSHDPIDFGIDEVPESTLNLIQDGIPASSLDCALSGLFEEQLRQSFETHLSGISPPSQDATN